MDKEEINLDVIPININEMYPTKDMIWHYMSTITKGLNREHLLNLMIADIKQKFIYYNAVIILEKGKVIKIL